MNIIEMSDVMFHQECMRLFVAAKTWINGLNGRIGKNANIEPDVAGSSVIPLAGPLKEVWDYAIGNGPKPSHIEETVYELMAILWTPISGKSVIPDDYESEPFGFMIKLAKARDAFERGEALSTSEAALLSGYGEGRIRQLIKMGEIKAQSVNRVKCGGHEYKIDNKFFKRWLKKALEE